MKQHRNKIIVGVVTAMVFAFLFWWGGDASSLRGWNVGEPQITQEIIPDAITLSSTLQQETKQPNEIAKESNVQDMEPVKGSEIDSHQNTVMPEDKPEPMESETVVVSDKALTCTLSVRCDTILEHIDWLDAEKVELVPENGVIFAEQTVTFYEGESVFHLLVREMKRNKIHMEFETTPIYNSAYIEGIANLYEFDCGELSGWMYKVNDWFPNYGCSSYLLKEGDKVEWVYTCDLGADVGENDSTRNGM